MIYCVEDDFDLREPVVYALNKELKLICRELGIPPRKEYAFRITYGTILLDEGIDKAFIKSAMGHVSINTTKLHYHKDRRTF